MTVWRDAKRGREDAERRAETEPSAGELVVPVTGELVDLADPTQVCDVLHQVRQMKHRLDQVRAALEDALRLESERQGTKTMRFGDLTAVVSGGEKVEYDIQALSDELLELGLPEDRLGQLVVQVISYRLNQNVARQLAGSNVRYAEALDRHRRVVPDRWRVTVKKGHDL